MIQKPKGTNDLFGNKMLIRQQIEKISRDLFEKSLISEIRTPVFEDYTLFNRSIGESSDVVNKEMYDFYDKGKRHIALRPEGTASVIRAYNENKMYADPVQPQKFYYIESMYRYERPGAGRMREFNQVGVEIIGKYSASTDVETILLAFHLLKKLKVSAKLVINNIGDFNERKEYVNELQSRLEKVKDKLSNDSQRRLTTNPLRILDSKEDDVDSLIEMPSINDYLTADSIQYFEQIKKGLDSVGIEYTQSNKLVRGLDYYTNLVFEFVNEDGLTVLGGGRYNQIVSEIGSQDMPGIGFAAGIERIEMLTKLELEQDSNKTLIVALEENLTSPLIVANRLREINQKTQLMHTKMSFKASFNLAERQGCRYIIFIGKKEELEQKLTIKDVQSGESKEVEIEKIEDYYTN
jgi:histidyl-tRNA synthetase